MEFNDLREKLYAIRNSNVLDDADDLYIELIRVEKNGRQSRFNELMQLNLFYECAYRYNREKGLQSLVKIKLPFEIDKNISFEKFCMEFEKYQETSIPNDLIENDDVKKLVLRAVTNRLLDHSDWGGWTFINYNTIEGEKSESTDLSKKIYISVDNKDLHEFAMLLLKECDERNIKYDFKINADDSYRRADNVVIYTSDEDFKKYINAIKKIKMQNPFIDFGKGHPLAYHYNDYIGVAPIEEKGSNNSYSENICDKIQELRYEENITFDEWFEKSKSFIVRQLADVESFCELNKMMNENSKKSSIQNEQNKKY